MLNLDPLLDPFSDPKTGSAGQGVKSGHFRPPQRPGGQKGVPK